MDEFSFEHAHQFTAHEYVELHGTLSRKYRPLRRLIVVAVAIICLFFSYTFVIGIGILALVALLYFAPHLVSGTAAKVYKTGPWAQLDTSYGIDDAGITIKNSLLSANIPWNETIIWRERGDWLCIESAGAPAAWFKIAELKDADLYETVLERCEKFGTRFKE